jgi:hypothetical protein
MILVGSKSRVAGYWLRWPHARIRQHFLQTQILLPIWRAFDCLRAEEQAQLVDFIEGIA